MTIPVTPLTEARLPFWRRKPLHSTDRCQSQLTRCWTPWKLLEWRRQQQQLQEIDPALPQTRTAACNSTKTTAATSCCATPMTQGTKSWLKGLTATIKARYVYGENQGALSNTIFNRHYGLKLELSKIFHKRLQNFAKVPNPFKNI